MSTPPIRVVIVEDTDSVRRFLGELLDTDGFEIVGVATSGSEGLRLMENADQVDAMVIDFKMAGMDGVATAEHARARRPELTIVLYTAYDTPELRHTAKEAGVDLVIGKIDGINRLEDAITEIAARRASSDQDTRNAQ